MKRTNWPALVFALCAIIVATLIATEAVEANFATMAIVFAVLALAASL